jgi:hypothetical protein
LVGTIEGMTDDHKLQLVDEAVVVMATADAAVVVPMTTAVE